MELANKGTLFLDEIGDMPLALQGKLLHVLQEKRIMRVGGGSPIAIDIHILAATNRDLKKMIKEETFREDLYYRLNIFPIHILPLKERKDEIPELVDYYLEYYNRIYDKQLYISQEALEEMERWEWEGNVRQLEAFIERMVILHNDRIDSRMIIEENSDAARSRRARAKKVEEASKNNESGGIFVREIMPLQTALEETERQLFLLVAEEEKSSYKVAEILQISQTNAYRKMKKYKKE